MIINHTCCMLSHTIKWIKKHLKKLFSSLFGGKSSKYVQPIIDSACNKGYVESYSNKADSLHLNTKKLYEEDLQAGFIQIMNKLAKHFRKGRVRLAIDFQEEGFYGKTDHPYIIGTSYKGKSYPKAFKFITISILTGKKEERIPLYALPWHIGQDLVDSITILVSTVQHWFSKIEIIQFDRGFHKKELILFLEDNNIPYLMHIKKQGKYLKDLVKSTKSFYRGKYSLKVNMNKSNFPVKTNLFVCKDVEKKDWLFVSSIWFKNKWQVRNYYRNRWQIETNYAVHNSCRLMSKSTDYIIRYFYYLVDTLIQVLWRLSASRIPLRTFLFTMVVGIKRMLMKKPYFVGD